ncbi:MAG: transglycosylase domain-containing protein [[Clostridium] scindens]
MGKKRKLFNCLIFLIYMVLGSAVFFGIKGYGMYREAIKEEPIDLRIEKKRSQENYVDYDSLPQFYVKATISIEDRRFEDHGGIDLIAIGRAAWRDIRSQSLAERKHYYPAVCQESAVYQDKKFERGGGGLCSHRDRIKIYKG